jgi:hypothetical protein
VKVRYIGSGDPSDNTECEVFGLSFTKGEWVDLAEVPAKLLTNGTFEVSESKSKRGKSEPDVEVLPPE